MAFNIGISPWRFALHFFFLAPNYEIFAIVLEICTIFPLIYAQVNSEEKKKNQINFPMQLFLFE